MNRPRRGPLLLLLLLLTLAAGAAELRQFMLKLSEDDIFTIAESDTRSVKVEHYQPMRHADVRVTPKTGAAFSLMLYFKRDTTDLGNFDTAEKMKRAVLQTAQKFLPGCVEREIQLQTLNHQGRYGFYTVQTDAQYAPASKAPEVKFKFATRGMVRLSTDTALGFSLQTNAVNSKEYKELLDYILSFIQPAA